MTVEKTNLERCGVHDKTISSRCILRKDHAGKHAFPNKWLKEHNPEVFGILAKRTWGVHEDDALEDLALTARHNPPPSSAEKEK